MASTITVLRSIEWAKRYIFNKPTVVGNFGEPAMTSAATVMQTILGPPFAWRWNRVTTGFISVPGQQDYLIFNWAATTLVRKGWMLVDSNGNSQTVTTTGTTGGTIPSFNNTISGTTTDGSAVWFNLGPIPTTTSPTYSFAWMETQSVQDTDVNTGTPFWIEIRSHISLGLDSAPSRPEHIAAEFDDGNGNITFRVMPVPDKPYPIIMTLQKSPPLITNVNQTWAPIPDEFANIYNWGLLSLLFLYADDPRFPAANQKFVASLISSSEGLSETDRNIVLNTWFAITGQPIVNQNKVQQGTAARGSI